jgi:predicted neuraminidase
MRENGITDRIRVSESRDEGLNWSPVQSSELPNPGSGLDAVRLANGHWAIVYNDSVKGRNSLAVSLSTDEGKTWSATRHLEQHADGKYHYPALIQTRDGRLHCVYSYFVEGGKSMKHAAFDEEWIAVGDADAK